MVTHCSQQIDTILRNRKNIIRKSRSRVGDYQDDDISSHKSSFSEPRYDAAPAPNLPFAKKVQNSKIDTL
jgi:hypothetical protein